MLKDNLERLQPDMLATFQQILQDEHLVHAYLFVGGLGSFEMALYLAQSRFCEELVDKLPCGHCRPCRLIAQQEFSDVSVLSPVGNIIKTASVRSLLTDLYQSGFEKSCQVLIVRDAETLHPNAANSLLKFIEEPQSDVYIFLLTQQEQGVLSTIRSRTQIFNFPKQDDYLVDYLLKDGLLKTQADMIAQLASDFETAQQLARSQAFLERLQATEAFVRLLLTNDNQAYLRVTALVNQAQEKSQQDEVLEMMTYLLAKHMAEPKARLYLERLVEAKKMKQANVSLQNVLEYMIIS